MAITTRNPQVVRISPKGQATIPKELRDQFGIQTPGEVFVYAEDGRIVFEPVPSPDELHGIHAGDESGEILERVREIREAERIVEEKRAERYEPSDE